MPRGPAGPPSGRCIGGICGGIGRGGKCPIGNRCRSCGGTNPGGGGGGGGCRGYEMLFGSLGPICSFSGGGGGGGGATVPVHSSTSASLTQCQMLLHGDWVGLA